MQELSELIESAQNDFAQAKQPAALEDAKARYIGKTGRITMLMKELGKLAPEERRARGQEINRAKAQIELRSTRAAKRSPKRRSPPSLRSKRST